MKANRSTARSLLSILLKTIALQLPGRKEQEPFNEYVVIDSNARNAGKSGYFLIIQYGGR
jgi:hypothetical protein